MLDEFIFIEISGFFIGGKEIDFVLGNCVLSIFKGFFRILKIVVFVVDS